MVRLPLTQTGPEAFKLSKKKTNPSLYDVCRIGEFNPPSDAFYCNRTRTDNVTLPEPFYTKCQKMINFLTRDSLCDGYQDCLNNEDENVKYCRSFKCGKKRFKCKKGPSYQCIHIVSKGSTKKILNTD